MNTIFNTIKAISCLMILALTIPQLAIAQGQTDQPLGNHGWFSYRNMSQASYQAKINEMKSKGMRPTDVEIQGGSKRTYSVIFRQNKDKRAWEVRTALTNEQFSAKWNELKDKGFRPIDQETHVVKGKRYYGAIWIKNTEKYGWASFRNLSHQDYSKKFNEYKAKGYMPVDIDAYQMGSQMRYSVIWVQNKSKLAWAQYRNIPQSQFSSKFQEMSRKGYRLTDLESYRRSGKQEYATIWVRESRAWVARRDMSSTWFSNYWNSYRDQGYRLEDVAVYATASGTRYAGVWVMNESRHNWKYKNTVKKKAQDYLKENPSAGMSIAVAQNGQVKYMSGFGHADIERKKNAHGKTVYRLASVSKAVTGILAFRLQAKRRMSINSKTRSLEKRLPAHHTHTVGQLLSNRGRVRHYKSNDPASVSGTIKVFPNAYEASKLFMNDPLLRDKYKYSTHGYTLAAAAMEKAAGKTLPNILRDELSRPFGLSSLKCEYRNQSNSYRSKIYSANNGGGFSELTPKSLSWKFAGGGMEASAFDMMHMGIKLMDNKILRSQHLSTMTTKPDNLRNYAYGWDVGTHKGQKFYAKSGGQPGSRAYIICFPDKKIVVTVLCNTRGNGVGDFSKEIAELMF